MNRPLRELEGGWSLVEVGGVGMWRDPIAFEHVDALEL